jgi:hypothetical protein
MAMPQDPRNRHNGTDLSFVEIAIFMCAGVGAEREEHLKSGTLD